MSTEVRNYRLYIDFKALEGVRKFVPNRHLNHDSQGKSNVNMHKRAVWHEKVPAKLKVW